ncbi:hypothetical protein J2Z48_000599 [Croceifilum oryzae]|uniref:Uncharacterized protein n=1 Tax=Croceifilum oryzae TaxID=1553429 RepID=A0AAJ1TCN7_9BACL|nr:hypothetical protein [Croceifilum oryzae]
MENLSGLSVTFTTHAKPVIGKALLCMGQNTINAA